VHLHDPQGRPIEHASFGPHPGFGEWVTGQEGRFAVTRLDPGGQELVVRPDGDFESTDCYYAPIQVSVEVPSEGFAELELVAQPAGRLAIAARDAAGNPLPARCVLHDATGATVPVRFFVVQESEEGEIASVSASDDKLHKQLSHVDPPLAPGRYDVELSMDGFLPEFVPVTIAAGRTTSVSVTLERE
jgi:hypothetical protein